MFDGLAQELLAGSLAAVVAAGERVKANSSVVDGLLFVLKHVALLRDEARELAVGKAPAELGLDFGRLRSALAGLMRLQGASPVQLLMPELSAHAPDARRDLELVIVHTQDALVHACVGTALQSLQGALARLAASSAGGGPAATAAAASGLSEEKLVALVKELRSALGLRLPESLAAAKLYLPAQLRAPLFQALQTACTEPPFRLLSAVAANPQSELAQTCEALKQFVQITTAEML